MADDQSETTDAALTKVRRHIRILEDVARAALQSGDIDLLLDEVVLHVARAVEVNHTKIMRYRRDTADLLMIAGRGWKGGVVGSATFSTDLRSPPGRAFQTGEGIVIANAAEAPDFTLSPVLNEHGIVSLANVPILVDGAAWGVLEVDSTLPRDFTSDTNYFLSIAASIVGIGIKHRLETSADTAAMAAEVARAQMRSVLLRELQHRVKNNFQLILSSISIQKRNYGDSETGRVLDHVAARIQAMSLAHDQLSASEEGQFVDVANYLRVLCHSVQQQAEGVAIDLEADDVALPIDRAVSLGLILNELITNSVKHAFGGGTGRISVSLASGVGFGDARLVVADDGSGIGELREGGSGIRLIEALARHVGGLIEQRSSPAGTSTSLTFPVLPFGAGK